MESFLRFFCWHSVYSSWTRLCCNQLLFSRCGQKCAWNKIQQRRSDDSPFRNLKPHSWTPNKHSDIYSFGILKLMWTKSDHNNCILTFVVTLHVTRGPSLIYPICHSGCCCCKWCFLKSVALCALMLFTKHENMFPFDIISELKWFFHSTSFMLRAMVVYPTVKKMAAADLATQGIRV